MGNYEDRLSRDDDQTRVLNARRRVLNKLWLSGARYKGRTINEAEARCFGLIFMEIIMIQVMIWKVIFSSKP